MSVRKSRILRSVALLAVLFVHTALNPLMLVAAEPSLADRLEPLIKRHPGNVAVAIRHLGTGDEYTYRADEPMPTASLIKLPVMVTAYRLVDAGKADLKKPLSLKAEDKVPGSGILTTHFSPGTTISLRDAIRLMIAYSDNTATNLVLDEIGLRTTADTMEELGFPNTKIHAKVFRGETSIFPDRSKKFGLGSATPREIVQLLSLLYEKKIASSDSCDAMLEHLSACEDKDKFPRELPPGTKVAHKTGSVSAVRTDAGIIFAPSGPVAICVMTSENEDKRWTRENAAEVLCGRIARVAYDFFNPTKQDPASSPESPLMLGASGALVEALQRTLNQKLSPPPELSVDGEFGPVTRQAVIRFQIENQLAATGEVGPDTWKALGPLRLESAAVPEPAVVNSETLARQPAEELFGPPLATCKAWAIADGKTGVLLWGQNERQRLHFASTTKVMTAYVVLQEAAQDAAVFDESITFSKRADDTIGSTADVRAGERVTVRDLLYGLLLPSGNDAATALAEHFGSRFSSIGGGSSNATDSHAAFIDQMNATAKTLGMHDTHFSNPHGLTDPNHQSTAADLLLLARAARELPEFRHYTATRQHGSQLASTAGYTRNVIWKNTNKLLTIDGYDGVKTGTTDAAGACLISAGEREGDELLVVVLGSATSDARYVDTRNLFRWAWRERQR